MEHSTFRVFLESLLADHGHMSRDHGKISRHDVPGRSGKS